MKTLKPDKGVFGKLADIETFKPKRPPLKQGVDSLCSLYSILNAIGYLNSDFNYKKARALFNEIIIKIYEGKSSMVEVQELITEGSHRLPFCCLEGTPYELKKSRLYYRKAMRPTTVNQLMADLAPLINNPDTCAIVTIQNIKKEYCHYTVVWGISDEGLHLLDSSTVCRILKPHQLVIDGEVENAGKRFRFFPAETMIVKAKR